MKDVKKTRLGSKQVYVHSSVAGMFTTDSLVGVKSHVRLTIQEKVNRLLALRKNYSEPFRKINDAQKRILLQLFEIAVCRYSGLRRSAHSVLQLVFEDFSDAFEFLLPNIIEVLQKDPDDNKEAYEVCYFFMLLFVKFFLKMLSNFSLSFHFIGCFELTVSTSSNGLLVQYPEQRDALDVAHLVVPRLEDNQ